MACTSSWISLFSLWRAASISFSPRAFFQNFSALDSVKRHANQDSLTQSSLLDLLSCKGEGRKKFYHYLHQNDRQSRHRRDPDKNPKFAEGALEGLKDNDECVVAGVDVFDRLRNLNVTEICKLGSEKGTYSK